MSKRKDQHRILKGALTGAIGGLIAAWSMNRFQSALQEAEKAWEKSKPQSQSEEPQSSDSDDATMKTADRLASLVTHRHLTQDEKKQAGPIVHYAYGALLGAVYGGLSEIAPVTRLGLGTAFATAAWLFGDEIAVPALGLSGSPLNYPASAHAKALAAHLAYGVSLEGAQHSLRKIV